MILLDIIRAKLEYLPQLAELSLTGQVVELSDDPEIDQYTGKEIREALIEMWMAKDVVYTLNKLQAEGRKHRMLDPIDAIAFALHVDDGLEFLRSWNQGDWKMCAYCWPEWKDFRR